MGLSDELKKKIGEALAQEKVATRDDLLDDNFLGFTLSPDYSAYANVRTTLAIDQLTRGELTHLKFTPIVPEGIIIGEAAAKGEVGAEEFTRTETRRSGQLTLRAALRGFDLEWQENRNLLLPIVAEEIPMPDKTQKKVIVISVKRPTTKERVSRPRKSGKADKTPDSPRSQPAAGAQPETQEPKAE